MKGKVKLFPKRIEGILNVSKVNFKLIKKIFFINPKFCLASLNALPCLVKFQFITFRDTLSKHQQSSS